MPGLARLSRCCVLAPNKHHLCIDISEHTREDIHEYLCIDVSIGLSMNMSIDVHTAIRGDMSAETCVQLIADTRTKQNH